MSIELSQKDIDDMNEEINERIQLRSSFHDDIVMARSYGDLSENAEYHSAKHVKNKNEGRIRYLRSLIKNATIIESSPEKNIVGYFDRVKLYFEDEDAEEYFVISSKVRIDMSKGVISKESPLGSSIFGKKIGDKILVEVSPDVKYFVVIKDIQKNVSVDDIPLNKF